MSTGASAIPRADTPGPHSGDLVAVTAALGRAPAAAFTVVVRGPQGAPAVIENAPYLRDGTPMPTRYWLVDVELRVVVAKLESAGGVRAAEAQVDPKELAAAHTRYARERDATLTRSSPGPRPGGGVGGARRGVKCLHAHLAWWLAGGDDPVGRWTAAHVGVAREAPFDGVARWSVASVAGLGDR